MTSRQATARRSRPSSRRRLAVAAAALLAGGAAAAAITLTSGPGPQASTSPPKSSTHSTSTHNDVAPSAATSTTTTIAGASPGGSASKSHAPVPAKTGGSTTPTNPATTISLNFRPDTITTQGIYEFSGGNSATDAGNPDLAGTTLTFEWAQLEPSPGQFSWARVDQAIAPWAAAGKHVILRVSAGGEASWGSAAANATPAWVYAQGVPSVEDAGSTLPAYWNPTFLSDYDAFIAAYAAHYDGNPAVSFIQMGIGEGGETLPDTQGGTTNRLALWTARGYSDAVWLATVENIATTFRDDFHRTPVVPLVDSSFLSSGRSRLDNYTTLTGWFVANGFPMQYDGLTSTSTPQDADWAKTTTIVEQRGATSSSGDTLAGDCSDATGPMESKVILIYQSDIDNPTNQGALNACAASLGS
jgi:hypothetical protein